VRAVRLALRLNESWTRIAGGVARGAVTVAGAGVSALAALVCLLGGSAALVLIERTYRPSSHLVGGD
jgi:hypothetical protein